MALKQWHKTDKMATINKKIGWNYYTDFYIVDRYFKNCILVFLFSSFRNFYL